MITPQEARQILESVGIKHKSFATIAGIHPVWFSDWICGRRILDPERLSRIDKYCNEIKIFSEQKGN